MSPLKPIAERIARFLPDKKWKAPTGVDGYIGQPIDRVDGSAKVTGQARFTAEFVLEDLAHAVFVCSTIAKGRVTSIDDAQARNAPGIITIITHQNAPPMKRPSSGGLMHPKTFSASNLAILQDNQIHWNGQPVAVVVAETLEQAQHAASLVEVHYETQASRLSFDDLKSDAQTPKDILGEPPELERGNIATGLSEADLTVDHLYRTPWYNHNALEPHATMAKWTDDGRLVVFDSTQNVTGYKASIAQVFGVDPKIVRVIAHFVGGGFGGKAGLWTNTLLCVAAAKVAGRPVRLVLSRKDVYRTVGGRTLAEQRVALGAKRDGRLTGLLHTAITTTPDHARYAEQCTFPPRHLYASENIFVGQKVVNLDTVANTWMRAPGESIGTFALESAVDELAVALKLDPIELRRINEPTRDPTRDAEFSIRHLNEAYERGADRFGWRSGPSGTRGRREGRWLIGQGVATAYYPVLRFPGKARIRLSADGTAVIEAAANEVGTATATVQIQHAADRLAIPLDRVSFAYGNSDLPDSPMAGGSNQSVSIAASIEATVEKLHRALLDLANSAPESPLFKAKYEDVHARAGGLFLKSEPTQGETYADLLSRAGRDVLVAEGSSSPPVEWLKYSMASYGAQFCEVRVDQDSGEVHVSRWVGSFDCGRVLNAKTATSQIRGGIIMGIGMALMEETLFDDRRTGAIMNASLSDYHVPVHLDVPPIDVLFNDIPDPHTPLGAHGIGEIGITGVAAAIANAIFDATGKRIRSLPMTLDKLF